MSSHNLLQSYVTNWSLIWSWPIAGFCINANDGQGKPSNIQGEIQLFFISKLLLSKLVPLIISWCSLHCDFNCILLSFFWLDCNLLSYNFVDFRFISSFMDFNNKAGCILQILIICSAKSPHLSVERTKCTSLFRAMAKAVFQGQLGAVRWQKRCSWKMVGTARMATWTC